jgi:hypothetical protein
MLNSSDQFRTWGNEPSVLVPNGVGVASTISGGFKVKDDVLNNSFDIVNDVDEADVAISGTTLITNTHTVVTSGKYWVIGSADIKQNGTTTEVRSTDMRIRLDTGGGAVNQLVMSGQIKESSVGATREHVNHTGSLILDLVTDDVVDIQLATTSSNIAIMEKATLILIPILLR